MTTATDGLRVSWNASRPASLEYQVGVDLGVVHFLSTSLSCLTVPLLQCVRALGCPGDCGLPSRPQVGGGSALLQGLQAHALYRVTVAVEDEERTLEATTPLDGKHAQ